MAEGGHELRLEIEMRIDLVENELLRFVVGLEGGLQLWSQLLLQLLLEGGDAVHTALLVRQSLEESDGAGHVFQNGRGHLEWREPIDPTSVSWLDSASWQEVHCWSHSVSVSS